MEHEMREFRSLIKRQPVIKRKYWGNYNKLKKEKEWLEWMYIVNASRFAKYKDGELYWPGKNHRHHYSQYCMGCGAELKNIHWRNGKLNIRIFVESLGNGLRKMYFLCSKNCYDAIRISKKKHPDKFKWFNPEYLIISS